MRGIVLTALVGIVLFADAAQAGETDFRLDNTHWNGLSELAGIARGLGLPVEPLDELRWDDFDEDPESIVLLLVHPATTIDPNQALAFLQRGGRLLVADDFGQAAELLRIFGLRRFDGSGINAQRHHDQNPNLPIALLGRASHPLTRGVDGIVTNHPAYFRSRLPTLLGFDGGRQQVVVAGDLGQGRFVALSDPSVLINNMLRFRGNLRLTTNILRHLGRPGRDRVYLVTGHVHAHGMLSPNARSAGGKRATRLAREFNVFVARINDFALTAGGMRTMAFLFGALVVGGLALLLPLPRRDLDGHWTRPASNIQPAAAKATQAAAVLREEVEERLTTLLDAPGPISAIHPKWLTERVHKRAGPEAAAVCQRLLNSLKQVPYLPNVEETRISRREFASIYEQSAQLLRLLGADDLDPLPQSDNNGEEAASR